MHLSPVFLLDYALDVSGKDSSSFTLRLHACPPPGFFKPSRFHPQRNNIRTEWYTGLKTSLSGKIAYFHCQLLKYQQSQSADHSSSTERSLSSRPFISSVFVVESSEPPTPHYNSSVLGDLLPRAHLQFLSAVSSQCSAFASGVTLLKVWLRQRELDQVGGLQWLLYLLHRDEFLVPEFLCLFTLYLLI